MKANCLGVVVLASSLFLSSCGGGDPLTSPPDHPASLDLHLLGLEGAVAESAAQGKDQSLTLTLSTFSQKAGFKQKPVVLYTKTVRVDDPTRHFTPGDGAEEAGAGEDVETEENLPVTLSLPSDATEIEAAVVGDQSGTVVSERIAIEPNAEGKATLFANMEMLSSELANQVAGPSANLSLYTIVEGSSAETSGSPQKAKGTWGKPQSESEADGFSLMRIDATDGSLKSIGHVRGGHGGDGAIGTYSDDRELGFVFQKGKVGDTAFSGHVRTDDGTLKPLVLPSGSTPKTIAHDSLRGRLYILKTEEGRLLVQQRNDTGSF